MPHPVDIHVGKRLRKIRHDRGITQAEVATKLNLSFQQIQKYETGANRMSASRLFEISTALGVETSALFEGLNSGSGTDGTPDTNCKISEVVQEIAERLRVIDALSKI